MSEWLVFETLYNVPIEWIPTYQEDWYKYHPYIDKDFKDYASTK